MASGLAAALADWFALAAHGAAKIYSSECIVGYSDKGPRESGSRIGPQKA